MDASTFPLHSLRRLSRRQLPVDTVTLARYLIGKALVRELPQGRIVGRIVETEAYVPGDAACHAHVGLTERNRALFMERGHAYVYFIYGTHFMLNVCSEKEGVGAGVLLRALEPLEGIPLMQKHRGVESLRDLARGPGRLAEALKIDMHLYGTDYCAAGPLWLGGGIRPAGQIGRSVRIGITKEAQRPLRFYERNNPYVSGPQSMRR